MRHLAYELLIQRGKTAMLYRKDRFGEKFAITGERNIYFAEKDRPLTQRLRVRLRNREGAVFRAKGIGSKAQNNGPRSKTYLVPIDFSKRSEAARMSRETNEKLVLCLRTLQTINTRNGLIAERSAIPGGGG